MSYRDNKISEISLIIEESDSSRSSKRLSDATGQIDLSHIAEKMLATETKDKTASLVILGGHDVGRVIPVDCETFVLGRSPDCNYMLIDDGVSRFHAEITNDGSGGVEIRDLSSTNGTFINGKKITEASLNEGDKVLLGRKVVLKFAFQDSFEETYQKKIYESSTRDGLTGTYNRKYLIEKMVTDLSFARRHHIPFTLLIFDLDHFKTVNDTYGHQIGDKALVLLAEVVNSIIRTEDLLARYGGEEFAIVAPGTDAKGGETLGERIRHRVAKEQIQAGDGSGEPFSITISVGVATVHPKAVVDSATVISIADKNLYAAKEAGRNRVIASLIE